MQRLGCAGCVCIIVLGVSAQAGLVFGPDAELQFQSLQDLLNEGFIDFESVPSGTNLMPGTDPFGLGVRFASIIDPYGYLFGPEHVEVSQAHNPAAYGNTIVGWPYPGGVDDGRVGYEIRFDTPQRRAGILRVWNIWSLTRFYNEAGDLLGTHQNTMGREFVGWISDGNDQSTWASRMVMDGLPSGGSRQVGYSDNLFFGIYVPTPSGLALLSLGLIGLRRRR